MKNIKLIISIAIVAISATSCVEKSDKYKAMVAQRDSLLVIGESYNQTLDILNEVENGFQSIRETETAMLQDLKDIEGQPLTKKQQLASQINQIKDVLELNKSKIAELQEQLQKSGNQNKALAATIKRMEIAMEAKNQQIAALESELASKNIKIQEMGEAIESLNSGVEELTKTTNEQKGVIGQQDADLHTAWYVLGESKELKEKKIVTSNGLFKAKTVMDGEFDKSAFNKVDIRTLSQIPTNCKKPKVLSSHPRESYNLVKGEDKLVTIEIKDAGKFWSISKYLVIQQ